MFVGMQNALCSTFFYSNMSNKISHISKEHTVYSTEPSSSSVFDIVEVSKKV